MSGYSFCSWFGEYPRLRVVGPELGARARIGKLTAMTESCPFGPIAAGGVVRVLLSYAVRPSPVCFPSQEKETEGGGR